MSSPVQAHVLADASAPGVPSCPSGRGAATETGRHFWLLWGLVLVAALILYGATLNRGIQWQDSGYFIVAAMTGELRNPLGLALSHPLHHWLSRLALRISGAEPALAVTLVSAVGGALAVANVFGCVYSLTRRRPAALFAAASLAVAHTFWKLSTVTEVYTLSAALLAAECWALMVFCRQGRSAARALWLAFLFNGLGVANHMQNALTTPVLLVVALWVLRRAPVEHRPHGRFLEFIIALGLWVGGTLPYSGLVVAEAMRLGDWSGALHSAVFGEVHVGYSRHVFNVVPSLRVMLVTVGFTLLSFPNLFLPAAVWGLATSARSAAPPGAIPALIAGLALHGVFAARYDVVDQYTFFLPVYLYLAIFAGLGAARWLEQPPTPWRRRVAAASWGLWLLTPAVYAIIPAVSRAAGVLDHVIHHKPCRDDYIYLLSPWGVADDSAERMSRQAVELCGPAGVILLEDLMARPAIVYQLLRRGWNADRIVLVSPADPAATADQAIRHASDGPVVLVPLNVRRSPPDLPPGYGWRREGDLFILSTAPESP